MAYSRKLAYIDADFDDDDDTHMTTSSTKLSSMRPRRSSENLNKSCNTKKNSLLHPASSTSTPVDLSRRHTRQNSRHDVNGYVAASVNHISPLHRDRSSSTDARASSRSRVKSTPGSLKSKLLPCNDRLPSSALFPLCKHDPPFALALPLLILVNFTLNFLLVSIISGLNLADHDLATISRRTENSWFMGALLIWRSLELILAWSAGLDYHDVFSQTLLSHAPHFMFLYTFYTLKPFPLLASLLTDALCAAIPFMLFRVRSPDHRFELSKQFLRLDALTMIINILTSSAVYAITIPAACRLDIFKDFINTSLASGRRNERLNELTLTYDSLSHIFRLIIVFIPLGWAAQVLIFSPAESRLVDGPMDTGNCFGNVHSKVSRGRRKADEVNEFGDTGLKDSVSETLLMTSKCKAEHLGKGVVKFFNILYPSPRTRVIIGRTTMLCFYTIINVFLRTGCTILNAHAWGALIWGLIWATSSVLVGMIFCWVTGG